MEGDTFMKQSSAKYDLDNKREWLHLLEMSAPLGITIEQVKLILQSKNSSAKENYISLSHD